MKYDPSHSDLEMLFWLTADEDKHPVDGFPAGIYSKYQALDIANRFALSSLSQVKNLWIVLEAGAVIYENDIAARERETAARELKRECQSIARAADGLRIALRDVQQNPEFHRRFKRAQFSPSVRNSDYPFRTEIPEIDQLIDHQSYLESVALEMNTNLPKGRATHPKSFGINRWCALLGTYWIETANRKPSVEKLSRGVVKEFEQFLEA